VADSLAPPISDSQRLTTPLERLIMAFKRESTALPSEIFVLLMTYEQQCKKDSCLKEAECIILGPENELLGFYCLEHGKSTQKVLEEAYQFKKEISPQDVIKKRKRRANLDKPQVDKICPNCRTTFKTWNPQKTFCKEQCRVDFWNKTNPRTKIEIEVSEDTKEAMEKYIKKD